MYNSPDVAIKIKHCAKIKKVAIKDMLSYCGLGANTLSHMNHGKSIAFDSLAKIADYLDCSVDYLLGRDTASQTVNNGDINNNNGVNHGVIGRVHEMANNWDVNNQTLTTQERDLLRIYKNANTRQQIKLMDFALSIEEEMKEERKDAK